MTARFVLGHQPDRGHHFTFVAPDGSVIFRSETYETHEACLEGIEAARREAPAAALEDQAVPPPG